MALLAMLAVIVWHICADRIAIVNDGGSVWYLKILPQLFLAFCRRSLCLVFEFVCFVWFSFSLVFACHTNMANISMFKVVFFLLLLYILVFFLSQ